MVISLTIARHKQILWRYLSATRSYSFSPGMRSRKLSGLNWTARGEVLAKATRQRQDMYISKPNSSDGHSNIVEMNGFKSELRTETEVSSARDITLSTPLLKIFHGMAIPKKPVPPGSDECCMSGCAICVYDLYITSLETYRDALKSLRAALISKNVPAQEWPKELQTEKLDNILAPRQDPGLDSHLNDMDSGLDVSLLAFAELEKSLRLQKKNESN